MKKQIVKVQVLHNVNLQPLASANVYWSEHIMTPDNERYVESEHSKQGVAVTDQNGVALIEVELQESVPDGFNIPFVYYNKVWVSVDIVKCNGFKDNDVKKVFPAIGEEDKDEDAIEHEFTVYMIPES